MPRCFQLTKKGETEPSKFSDIDNELCKHFGAEPSEKHYFLNWYNSIGLALAMGHDFEKIKEIFAEGELRQVADYLDEHYTANAWWEGR